MMGTVEVMCCYMMIELSIDNDGWAVEILGHFVIM